LAKGDCPVLLEGCRWGRGGATSEEEQEAALSLIFFLNGTTDSAISFRTLWTIFWLLKISNKPISLTTWLAVNPLNL